MPESASGLPMHFVTPVWGANFTRTFCEVTLPSLLAPGNIPSAPNLAASVYRIFTTPADEAVIARSDAYARLRKLVDVRFTHIEPDDNSKYRASSDCYRAAAQDAAAVDAAALFLIPDMVFADGGIRSIGRILDAGYRAVLVMGLRAVKETLVPEVQRRFASGAALIVPPRELVALALQHLHPIMDGHFVDGGSPGFHPSVFCWRVNNSGVLVRTFHLHPVAIRPKPDDPLSFGTIDDDLIEHSGLSSNEVYVVSDSDELLWFELSRREYRFPMPTKRTVRGVVRWMALFTREFHRSMFHHTICIHAGRTDDGDWRSTQERSHSVAEKVLAAYSFRAQRYVQPAAGWRRWLVNLRARAEWYLTIPGIVRANFPASLVKIPIAAALVVLFGTVDFIRSPLQKSREWSQGGL